MRFRVLLLLVLSVLFLRGAGSASAAISLKTYDANVIDAVLLKKLGFQFASIIYFKEMASITPGEVEERKDHERIGCDPFYIMKDANVEEKGYNCRTFFCAGYLKGPKQCFTDKGGPYGGVVEISRRLGMSFIEEQQQYFDDVPKDKQTPEMLGRIRELKAIRCRPFHIMRFDVYVGEGFDCDEVGTFPYFSPANRCTDDWRDRKGYSCAIPHRLDEYYIRTLAMDRGGDTPALDIDEGPAPAQTSSASSTGDASFPDVVTGQYGYTAIMDLARRGIVSGYADGTFRPKVSINRAEFVKMLIAGVHASEDKGEDDCFPDVSDAWYSTYVCAAKRLGWVGGYRDGTYRPEQTIRRDEGLKIVVASLGMSLDSAASLPPDVESDTWFTLYARKGMELRLILEPAFMPNVLATRADAAVWMYRSLKALDAQNNPPAQFSSSARSSLSTKPAGF